MGKLAVRSLSSSSSSSSSVIPDELKRRIMKKLEGIDMKPVDSILHPQQKPLSPVKPHKSHHTSPNKALSCHKGKSSSSPSKGSKSEKKNKCFFSSSTAKYVTCGVIVLIAGVTAVYIYRKWTKLLADRLPVVPPPVVASGQLATPIPEQQQQHQQHQQQHKVVFQEPLVARHDPPPRPIQAPSVTPTTPTTTTTTIPSPDLQTVMRVPTASSTKRIGTPSSPLAKQQSPAKKQSETARKSALTTTDEDAVFTQDE
jgi:hypothetical protein